MGQSLLQNGLFQRGKVTTFDYDDNDRLVILRHTLMNPYLVDHANGISYIDRYLAYLGGRIRGLLANRA